MDEHAGHGSGERNDAEWFARRVFDSMPDGVAVMDRELRILFVHPVTERMFAHAAPLAGKPCHVVFRAAPAPCATCPCRRAMATGRPEREMAPLFDAAGRRTGWVELYAVPIRDEATGEVTAVIEHARDLTAAVRAEEERLRLAAAVDCAGEGILVLDVDPDGASGPVVRYANPAVLRMTGRTAPDLVGHSPHPMCDSEEGVQAMSSLVRAVLRDGVSRTRRHVMRRGDGTTFPADVTISPFREPSGAARGYVSVVRDITREVEAEGRLRDAAKMDALGRLAGGVAHDFNNLLTVILAYAGFVESGLPADDPTRADVAAIRDAGERAASLARSLLTFARKGLGRPAPVDLREVVACAEPALRRAAGEGVRLVVRPGDGPRVVSVDAALFERALVSLAANARDAMPGGGTLTVEVGDCRTAGSADGEGHVACLCVTDTGHGMPPEVAAQAFEPFFTTKAKGTAPGLGLSVVYGVVRQAGGEVRLHSAPGAGTTVEIRLPLETAASARAVSSAPAPPVEGLGRTILLAEDEPAVRAATRRMLTAHGWRVVDAGDGVEVIALADAPGATFDLLVTDIVMPRMSGHVLAETLAARRPDLPIVFMTGFDDRAAESGGAAPGRAAWLQKPFGEAELSAALREAISKAR